MNIRTRFHFFVRRCRHFYVYAAGVVHLFLALIAGLAFLALLVRQIAPPALFLYSVAVALPVVLAAITVAYHLWRSKYLQMAIERGGKRKALRKAGLALIRSSTGKILLNKQPQEPWLHMWCLPGGYINREEHDEGTQDTVKRRVKALVGPAWDFDLTLYAVTNDSTQYQQLTLDVEYRAVTIHLYQLRRLSDGAVPPSRPIHEVDVVESEVLRWWSVADIRDEAIPVPPHMRDVILRFLDHTQGETSPSRFWNLVRDPEEMALQLSRD
jgi:ADP-ribose pyrophosphatase YjhB (NUDIX family)